MYRRLVSVDLDLVTQIAELLERLAMDRTLLDGLPAADRERLLRAIDLANNPDNRVRRRWLKAKARELRETRVRKDDDVLHATGIRTLRRKPVFTTPNFFPPDGGPAEAYEPEPPRASDELWQVQGNRRALNALRSRSRAASIR